MSSNKEFCHLPYVCPHTTEINLSRKEKSKCFYVAEGVELDTFKVTLVV